MIIIQLSTQLWKERKDKREKGMNRDGVERGKEEKEGEKRRMGKGEAGGEEKTREKNHHDTTLSMKSPIMVFVSQLHV